MRRLRHFKSRQEVSRHSCRSRSTMTVTFELGNDFALTQKMFLAVADMALDVGEVSDKDRPLHAPLYPFCRGHGSGGRPNEGWWAGRITISSSCQRLALPTLKADFKTANWPYRSERMSAFGRIADIAARLFYSRKQTSAGAIVMSALCQKRKSAGLLNHTVHERHHLRRNFKPQRHGGL
jgi:hypothetical protein